MSSNHNGENWPYHANRNTGEMTPCANNPCSLHGNSDVYATSPEDAYAKKYGSRTTGLFNKPRKIHKFAPDPVLIGIKSSGGIIAGLILSAGLIMGTQYANIGNQSETPVTVVSQSQTMTPHYKAFGKRGKIRMAYDTIIKNKNGDEVKIYTNTKLKAGDNTKVKEQIGLYGMTSYRIDGDRNMTIADTDNANKPDNNKTRNPILDGTAVTGTAAIAMGVSELLREKDDKTGAFRKQPGFTF